MGESFTDNYFNGTINNSPYIKFQDSGIQKTGYMKEIKPDVEIRYTDLATVCGDNHRFYALEEMISNESTKTSLIALACTQCGSLILHKVQAQ